MNDEQTELINFIFAHCDAYAPDYRACVYRAEYLWYAKQYAPVVLPIVLVVLALLFRKQLLNAFVSIAAALIRLKRRVSGQVAEVKNRIAEKANE